MKRCTGKRRSHPVHVQRCKSSCCTPMSVQIQLSTLNATSILKPSPISSTRTILSLWTLKSTLSIFSPSLACSFWNAREAAQSNTQEYISLSSSLSSNRALWPWANHFTAISLSFPILLSFLDFNHYSFKKQNSRWFVESWLHARCFHNHCLTNPGANSKN